MGRTPITPQYTCDVCGKPTARLLGMAAFVQRDTEDDAARASGFREARGYCRAHRDATMASFLADAAVQGTLIWSFDEDGGQPAELRPAEVPGWHRAVDALFTENAQDRSTSSQSQLFTPVDPAQPRPEHCPHCEATLLWDAGPHVAEARERSAQAWECTGCGAAGVLTS